MSNSGGSTPPYIEVLEEDQYELQDIVRDLQIKVFKLEHENKLLKERCSVLQKDVLMEKLDNAESRIFLLQKQKFQANARMERMYHVFRKERAQKNVEIDSHMFWRGVARNAANATTMWTYRAIVKNSLLKNELRRRKKPYVIQKNSGHLPRLSLPPPSSLASHPASPPKSIVRSSHPSSVMQIDPSYSATEDKSSCSSCLIPAPSSQNVKECPCSRPKCNLKGKDKLQRFLKRKSEYERMDELDHGKFCVVCYRLKPFVV